MEGKGQTSEEFGGDGVGNYLSLHKARLKTFYFPSLSTCFRKVSHIMGYVGVLGSYVG